MTTDQEKRPGSDDKAPRAANIFDVARLAGVSHQTVSRVLNDVPNVRPATRERVEQAIAQLRYSPSPAARALVTRRTRTIGLIAPGTSEYGPTSTAMNFNVAARAARFSVDTMTIPEVGPVGHSRQCRVALAAAGGCDRSGGRRHAVLEVVLGLDLNIPIVAVAASTRRSTAIVSIDQYRGARAAVRHLIELGHKRIIHLAGPPEAPDAIERIRGWRDEMSENRLEIGDVRHGDWSARSGYELGMALSDIGPGTAVFAANDYMRWA